MREIKFRAWHTQLKKMSSDPYDGEYTSETTPLNSVIRGCQKDEYQILMQYTGLKDKNGVEIYEGDILQFSDKWEWYRSSFGGGFLASKEDREEILSDHDKYPYERRRVEMPEGYEWLLSREILSYWEVIGNIYENPELLKGDN